MGNIKKSLRRHAKLNHAAVGGYGHMGRRASKPSGSTRAPDDRPEPMRVALSDFVGATPGEEISSMKRYHTIGWELHESASMCAGKCTAVYLASDVDPLIAENQALLRQLPCTCMWSGSVGPEGCKAERLSTCYRCQKLEPRPTQGESDDKRHRPDGGAEPAPGDATRHTEGGQQEEDDG